MRSTEKYWKSCTFHDAWWIEFGKLYCGGDAKYHHMSCKCFVVFDLNSSLFVLVKYRMTFWNFCPALSSVICFWIAFPAALSFFKTFSSTLKQGKSKGVFNKYWKDTPLLSYQNACMAEKTGHICVSEKLQSRKALKCVMCALFGWCSRNSEQLTPL